MINAADARANNRLARECEGLQAAINSEITKAIDNGENCVEYFVQISRFAVASTENVLEALGYDYRVTEFNRFTEERYACRKNVTIVFVKFEIEW